MTLTTSVMAAREALRKAIELANRDLAHISYDKYAIGVRFDAIQALATLPSEPMTEDALYNVVYASFKGKNMAGKDLVAATIRALKSANVLFVREE